MCRMGRTTCWPRRRASGGDRGGEGKGAVGEDGRGFGGGVGVFQAWEGRGAAAVLLCEEGQGPDGGLQEVAGVGELRGLDFLN